MNKISIELYDMFRLISGLSTKTSMLKALFLAKHLKLGSKIIVEAEVTGGETYTAYAVITYVEDTDSSDTAGSFLLTLDFIDYMEETNG